MVIDEVLNAAEPRPVAPNSLPVKGFCVSVRSEEVVRSEVVARRYKGRRGGAFLIAACEVLPQPLLLLLLLLLLLRRRRLLQARMAHAAGRPEAFLRPVQHAEEGLQ